MTTVGLRVVNRTFRNPAAEFVKCGWRAVIRGRITLARGGRDRAIQEADAIVIGPGSLYTSIIPNLLVAGVAEAIQSSTAHKIYICNLMTQPGETDGYSAADHIRALLEHLPAIDMCVLNSSRLGMEVAERYLKVGSAIVSGTPKTKTKFVETASSQSQPRF